MANIQQNTLYLTTPGIYVARDHLTLQVKVPLRPDGSPVTVEDLKSEISNYKSLSVPARLTGEPNTSVMLRRAHFRAADDPQKAVALARQMGAGKIQNSRNSLLR